MKSKIYALGKTLVTVLVAATISAVPASFVSAQSPPPASAQADDAKLTAEVETLLHKHPDLQAEEIAITVQTLNHVVYLYGTVDTTLQRSMAESTARKAPGVEKVVNSITVSR